MRKTVFLTTMTLILFGLGFLAFSCGSDDEASSNPIGGTPDGDDTEGETNDSDYMAIGKQALMDNDHETAIEAFDALLAEDNDNPQALYGRVLADVQHWLYLTNELLDFGGDVTTENADEPPASRILAKLKAQKQTPRIIADGDEDDESVSYFVDSLFGEYKTLSENARKRSMRLKEFPDVVFRLDGFPVYFGPTLLFSLHSEWDAADAHVIDAVMQGLFAMIATMDSQNVLDPDLVDVPQEMLDQTDSLMNVFVMWLNRYPEFLRLKGDGVGAGKILEARSALTMLADDILTAYQLIEAETDDQSDDVLALGTVKNGVEAMLMQGTFYKKNGETFSAYELLWQGTKYGFQNTAMQLKGNMAGEEGVRMRLEHDFIAMLGVVFDIINQTITIPGFLEQFGIEMSESITDFIDRLIGNPNNAEDLPRNVVSMMKLMGGFDPSAFEFDFGAFMARPIDARSMIPNHTTDPDDPKGHFFSESECVLLGYADASLEALEAEGRSGIKVIVENQLYSMDAPEVTMTVIRVDEESGEETQIDQETIPLQAMSDMANGFAQTVPFEHIAAGATGQTGDNKLQFSPEGTDSIVTTFTDTFDAENPIVLTAIYDEEGQTDRGFYDSRLTCEEDTSHDLPHFTGDLSEFSILPDSGEGRLTGDFQSLPADGYPGRTTYVPFRSGSMNNMLWVDLSKIKPRWYDLEENGLPEEMAKTNLFTFNLLMQFMTDKFASMGQMGGK